MRPFSILLMLFVSISCASAVSDQDHKEVSKEVPEVKQIVTDSYELFLPQDKAEAFLVLFGGFPEVADDIKREFEIQELAKERNVAILYSNFNQKLWLEEEEKFALAQELQDIVIEYELPADKVTVGGFSSGGVVSLLLSDYINGMKQFYIDPKGVFIIDSPIDLDALYTSSKKNIARNFSDVSVEESKWIINTLEGVFGSPEDHLENYEKYAVYTHRTKNSTNLGNLKRTKVRLYTEPDTAWWKENRMADYSQMNAYYIKQLSIELDSLGFEEVELIETTNKGYRANGERHPHSWSIVDKEDLFDWIMGE